jgi:hypothetical protein
VIGRRYTMAEILLNYQTAAKVINASLLCVSGQGAMVRLVEANIIAAQAKENLLSTTPSKREDAL